METSTENITKQPLTIIKVGGKIVEEPETLHRLLRDFARIGGFKALVHGGGRSATALAGRLGVETRMVNGRRITDADMLRVVTMVYGGLVNKNIVARLQAAGMDALGLTGADLNYMLAAKRPAGEVDYGFVGDVKTTDGRKLKMLVEQGIVPVLAPLTHDGNGSLLNTNADTIAAEAAKALAPFFRVRLVFCFEKPGVLRNENDDSSVIPHIGPDDFERYKQLGVIQGGMIPKLENAFDALRAGVHEVVITRADQLQSGGGTVVSF